MGPLSDYTCYHMASNAEREETREEGGESMIDFADNQECLKKEM